MMACHMPSSTDTSIAVVGAGAMGSVFAARLADGGADVVLVDVSAPLVERLNRDGLALDGPDGHRSVRLPATEAPGEHRPVDGVFVFVKCHQTAAAAELARPLVGPGTAVVSLQNGWGNGDVLAEAFAPDQLVVGVTYISATVRGPAHVAYSGNGPTFVGGWTEAARPLAERVAGWLRADGLDVELPGDVRTEIWKKLVLNAATLPTAALTGLAAGPLGRHPQMREVVRAAATEAVAAGRAAGYDLDEPERQEAIAAVLARAGDGKASMLQDVEAGRRTEIDVISGAVLRAGEAHGVPAPVTRTLHDLVKGLEAGRGLR
jgi:2-dehydropantoate 2-reductase